MSLIKGGKIVADPFVDASAAAESPASGAVIVSLDQWRTQRDAPRRRFAGHPASGQKRHARSILAS